MRKIVVALMILALCMGMAVNAYAADDTLSIPDVTVGTEQTIYVPVVLNASVKGDTIGVTYNYDKSVLEAVPGSATWGIQGVLQDFNEQDSGVWAASKPQELTGTICVLAFRVKKDVTLTETAVTCTVTIKNDAETVGTYTATGRIYAKCDHNYTAWTSNGELIHTRTCERCDDKQTQMHIWDEGVIADHPTDDKKQLMVYTCTICAATREQEIPKQESVQEPTAATQPTEVPDEPEYTTFPPDAPERATRPEEQRPENDASTRPTESQRPDNQNGQTGNQNQTQNTPGNQNAAGNQNSGNSNGNAGNQTGSGQVTDYNQSTGGQNNSGNQTGSNSQNNNGNGTGQKEQTGTDEKVESEDREHDHTHEEEDASSNRAPIAVTIPEDYEVPDHAHAPTEDPHAGHDHVHEAPSAEETGVSLLALLLAGGLVAAAVVLTTVLIKRMKRK